MHSCPKCDIELVYCVHCYLCPNCYRDFVDGTQSEQIMKVRQHRSFDELKADLQVMTDDERERLRSKQERAEIYQEIVKRCQRNGAGVLTSIERAAEDFAVALKLLGGFKDEQRRDSDGDTQPSSGDSTEE